MQESPLNRSWKWDLPMSIRKKTYLNLKRNSRESRVDNWINVTSPVDVKSVLRRISTTASGFRYQLAQLNWLRSCNFCKMLGKQSLKNVKSTINSIGTNLKVC